MKKLFPLTRALTRIKTDWVVLLFPPALIIDALVIIPVSIIAFAARSAARICRAALYRRRIRRLGLDRIASGYEFEIFIADLLKRNGYTNVVNTRQSGDYGADVLAEKDGLNYAVQCKFYSRPVGNKAVQEVYSAAQYYNCQESIVITNNTFTRGAIALAESTGTILWGRDELLRLKQNL